MFCISARKISVGFSSKPVTEVKSEVEFLLVNPEDLLAPSEPLAKANVQKLCFLSGVFRVDTWFIFHIKLNQIKARIKRCVL